MARKKDSKEANIRLFRPKLQREKFRMFMDQGLHFVYESRSLYWTNGEHMIDNMLFVLDSEFHLLDIWINNSTKRILNF